MNRRNFLFKASAIIAGLVILPKLSIAEKLVPEDLSYVEILPSEIGRGSLDFTENFFKYMKRHSEDVRFPYKRLKWPSFVVDARDLSITDHAYASVDVPHEIPMYPKTRKLKCQFIMDDDYNTRHGMKEHNKLSQTGRMEISFRQIIEEMNIEYDSFSGKISKYVDHPENNPINMFYIYTLFTSPTIYDPEFCPRMGFMIRYARLHEDVVKNSLKSA